MRLSIVPVGIETSPRAAFLSGKKNYQSYLLELKQSLMMTLAERCIGYQSYLLELKQLYRCAARGSHGVYQSYLLELKRLPGVVCNYNAPPINRTCWN